MKTADPKNNITAPSSYQDITQRARKLWECYGRPEGRDEEIWFKAERQVRGSNPLIEDKSGGSVSARQRSPEGPRLAFG